VNTAGTPEPWRSRIVGHAEPSRVAAGFLVIDVVAIVTPVEP
jgi:hypothetical protein